MKKFLFLSTIYCLLFTSVSAQSVDLIWQGEGYTPPFYHGRTLWAKQSEITFLAIPQGLGDYRNLNYKWIRNGTVLGLVSGVGRNTLSFLDTVFSKPVEIEVEIVSGEDAVLAKSSTTLTPVKPSLFVYENNPLYGLMFHREIAGDYRMVDKEATFTGFPYFFTTSNRNWPNLIYQWKNNMIASADGSSVTYRAPEENAGTALISLKVTNQDMINQRAEKSFSIQFGEQEQ